MTDPLNPDGRDLRIGIDLGGTRIKAGLVDPTGRILDRVVVDVGQQTSMEDITERLVRLVELLARDGTVGVGVAAAGVMDRRSGVIRESPNFPAWRDFDLAGRVAASSGLPVLLENDANAVVFGEAMGGAGRGVRDLVGLTLGTGVGGGLVLGGQLYRGARGMAGELGHVTVEPEGRPCACNNRGCLEQYVGQVGLRRTLAETGGSLASLADDADAPRKLAHAAQAGDERALAIWRQLGRYLGQAIATFVHVLDVQLILLCGGIAHSADLFLPALDDEFTQRTFTSMREGVVIRAGVLGEDAGIVGAAFSATA